MAGPSATMTKRSVWREWVVGAIVCERNSPRDAFVLKVGVATDDRFKVSARLAQSKTPRRPPEESARLDHRAGAPRRPVGAGDARASAAAGGSRRDQGLARGARPQGARFPDRRPHPRAADAG